MGLLHRTPGRLPGLAAVPVQYTDHDIRDRAYQYLRTDRLDSLPGLAVTATVLAQQRRRGVRCWVLLGREVTVLREAGATWRGLRMWTGLEERLLTRVAATFRSEPVPGADAFDRELTDLLDRVPPNPLRRICELTAVNRFHTEIARAEEDLLERVCADLDEAGVGRGVIAQHAGLSPATRGLVARVHLPNVRARLVREPHHRRSRRAHPRVRS